MVVLGGTALGMMAVFHLFPDKRPVAEAGLTNLSVSRLSAMAGVVYPRQVSIVDFCPL